MRQKFDKEAIKRQQHRIKIVEKRRRKRGGIKKRKKLKLFFKKVLQNQKKCGIIPKYSARPVGQAVKTLASHAGNMGSIPVRVTRKKHTFVYQDNVCFFQLNPPLAEEIHLRWMKSLRDEILLCKIKERWISSQNCKYPLKSVTKRNIGLRLRKKQILFRKILQKQ